MNPAACAERREAVLPPPLDNGTPARVCTPTIIMNWKSIALTAAIAIVAVGLFKKFAPASVKNFLS